MIEINLSVCIEFIVLSTEWRARRFYKKSKIPDVSPMQNTNNFIQDVSEKVIFVELNTEERLQSLNLD